MFSASSRAAASAASEAIVMAPSPRSEAPSPRLSKLTTRWRSASGPSPAAHSPSEPLVPMMRRTGSPVPVSLTLSLTPVATSTSRGSLVISVLMTCDRTPRAGAGQLRGRVDVQADVVQRRRVAELFDDALDRRLAIGVGHRAQADGAQVLARLGGHGGPGLQPRATLADPGGGGRGLRLLGCRIAPRPRAADLPDLGDVAVPAALRHEPAAGLQRGAQAPEE